MDEDDAEGEGEQEAEEEPEDEPEPEPEPEAEPDPAPAPIPEAAIPCDPEVWGGYECVTEDGEDGVNFCILVDDEEVYTECSINPPECEPGESWDQGCLGEVCYWDGDSLQRHYWSEPDCNTPLVLSFDGAPIEYAPAGAAAFDLSTDGSCMSTDWPTAPWLALDRDGNGFIEDGTELFGNATQMATGATAEHGFAALAELDSNLDGKITAADDRFDELVVWNDLDGDRIGAYAELRPVADMQLVSIDLGFDRRNACDSRGNCGFERAAFEFKTPQGTMGVGEVVDVHLACL